MLHSVIAVLTYISHRLVGASRSTKLLVEISRHGARSSSKIYPFTVDPDENFTEPSWLTVIGASEHHDMGAFIRQRFIEQNSFLSANYDPSEIYVQATEEQRTYDSAVSQLQGIYG